MTTHKAIREARQRVAAFLDERSRMRGVCQELITGANDCPLLVDDLRALLADLDAKTEALKSVQAAIYMDDAGQLRLTRSFDEAVIDAALKGTP